MTRVVRLGEIVFLTILLIVPSFLYAQTPLSASAIVGATNDARERSNIQPLVSDPVLTEVAQRRADAMAKSGYFAHETEEGESPWALIRSGGYVFARAAENLAVNYATPEKVVEGWMNSPGHRANVLDARLNEVGIGLAKGEYKGKEAWYVVQLLARPQSPQVAAVSNVASVSQPAAAVSTGVTVIASTEPTSTPAVEVVADEVQTMSALLERLRSLISLMSSLW